MAQDFRLPDGFRFGVATAGFQIEGGYNGPGEPANNWARWESEGRVEPSGVALDFWNDYEHQLDLAVAAGCDSFRLSVEWARCEPTEGDLDGDAIDRYRTILDACHERGLEPLVTFHHFTHPAWLGADFWLDTDSPDRFAEWVAVALLAFGDRCHQWVTLNEINIYALQTYLTGVFPPGRRFDVAATVRTLDHMLAGHVLAYEVVKEQQPDATVTTNNFPFSVYELDRLLVDILLARDEGISRDDLGSWLGQRRAGYYARLPQAPHRLTESLLRTRASRSIPLDQALPRAVHAVYDSPHTRALDVVAIDYYDPTTSNHIRLPGHRTSGGRSWLPARMLWDDPPNPEGFTQYCLLNHQPGLDLWMVENGLCNRVKNGRSFPRADGWDRVRYLRENLGAMVDAIETGIPVSGYWHWCLADNYEWGSYEPRFGLYGIDRERGLRWSKLDSMGADAAATYRRIADGLRAGDTSVVR
jgi:beta-glucosidase/6-phospho-beta-glucosidase/beta-galactosidase